MNSYQKAHTYNIQIALIKDPQAKKQKCLLPQYKSVVNDISDLKLEEENLWVVLLTEFLLIICRYNENIRKEQKEWSAIWKGFS